MKGRVQFSKKLNTEIKCVHYNLGGRENIHVSTSLIEGWQWKEFYSITRLKYPRLDVTIQKGGKNGVSVPFPDNAEWSKKNVAQALLDAGKNELCQGWAEVEEILEEKRQEQLAKEAEIAAKLKDAEEKEAFVNSFEIGQSYLIKNGFTCEVWAKLVSISESRSYGKMGKFEFTQNARLVVKTLPLASLL